MVKKFLLFGFPVSESKFKVYFLAEEVLSRTTYESWMLAMQNIVVVLQERGKKDIKEMHEQQAYSE